jgi:hypothetical protein
VDSWCQLWDAADGHRFVHFQRLALLLGFVPLENAFLFAVRLVEPKLRISKNSSKATQRLKFIRQSVRIIGAE